MANKKINGAIAVNILALAAMVRADSVLILGNGDDTNTEAAKSVLLADGHTSVTIGAPLASFDGTGLAGYNAVVILDGDQTSDGYTIPTAGQDALVNFVSNGGGLVTSEWTNWNENNGVNPDLEPILPVMPSANYTYNSLLTYTVSTANAVLDTGVPGSFTFNADDNGGTETLFAPKAGATTFFSSSGGEGGAGLVGWDYSSGKVISFSTLIAAADPDDPEMSDPNYSLLFSNSVSWAEGSSLSTVPLPASVYGGSILVGMVLMAKRLGRRSAAG